MGSAAQFVDGGAALGIAGTCAFIAIAASCVHMWYHLSAWSRPEMQKHVIRLIIMLPVYALLSFISLAAPAAYLYLATVRDIYEALVVYSFLVLIVEYCGGEVACLHGIEEQGSMQHPWPFCCLPVIQLGATFLRRCRYVVLIFVIVKPVAGVLSLVMLGAGYYHSPYYQWPLSITYNVVYTAALYALLLYYMATKELLRGFSPIFKFLTIKLCVIATYYQALLVQTAPASIGDADQWNNFILCIEMLGFATLYFVAFPSAEYEPGGAVGVPSVTKAQRGTVASRAGQAFGFADVFSDIADNFHSTRSGYMAGRGHGDGAPNYGVLGTGVGSGSGKLSGASGALGASGVLQQGHSTLVDPELRGGGDLEEGGAAGVVYAGAGEYGDAVGGGVDTERAAAALEASLLVDGAATATRFGVGREDAMENKDDGWGALEVPGTPDRGGGAARSGSAGGGTPSALAAPPGRGRAAKSKGKGKGGGRTGGSAGAGSRSSGGVGSGSSSGDGITLYSRSSSADPTAAQRAESRASGETAEAHASLRGNDRAVLRTSEIRGASSGALGGGKGGASSYGSTG